MECIVVIIGVCLCLIELRYLSGRNGVRSTNIDAVCGAVYTDEPGRPPLPTRLMAGLSILKHSYNLSDEVLCERWVENPYFQSFCGEDFFQHRLVFDRSRPTSLASWSTRRCSRRR